MYLGIALPDGVSPQYWGSRIFGGNWGGLPIRTPIYYRPVSVAPAQPPLRIVPQPPIRIVPRPPVGVIPGAGTLVPVPAGFPTDQIFVNSDGSFWQHGPNGWVNVGTPYGTGASATPAAPPPSPSGASSAPPAGTTAPGPVNVNVSASSGYREILDWLQEDTLSSYFGFSLPNWLVTGGIALIGYKVTSESRGRK